MGWSKQIPEPDGGWTLPPAAGLWADIALADDMGWTLADVRDLNELERVALLAYRTGIAAGG